MRRLAGPGRIVLTATDSAAQQFETVFPEFFLKAFDDPAADEDKNGRVSIWEAFSLRQRRRPAVVRAARPVADRTPAARRQRRRRRPGGAGPPDQKAAGTPGADGPLARTVYLAPEPAGSGDPELLAASRGARAAARRAEKRGKRRPRIPVSSTRNRTAAHRDRPAVSTTQRPALRTVEGQC